LEIQDEKKKEISGPPEALSSPSSLALVPWCQRVMFSHHHHHHHHHFPFFSVCMCANDKKGMGEKEKN
jgi:hypothetical protein